MHEYPDMDATWYGKLYKFVPFMTETGTPFAPSASTMRQEISAEELAQPLSELYSNQFPATHPEIIRHFVEYLPTRFTSPTTF